MTGFEFQKFTANKTSFAAKVTIRRTGQIGFSSAAKNRFKIEDYNFVVLYIDQSLRVVGIELLVDDTEGAIPLHKSRINTYVQAKIFCDCYHIDYCESHRYALEQDNESGYLYFRLQAAITKAEATQ